MKIALQLKLLAPYLAVGVFWCGLSNGWLAILAYHAQVVFWMRADRPALRRPTRPQMYLWALPTVITGPLVYYLLPHITHTELSVWLVEHGLSRASLLVMIPYFGLVHPLLEQVHWGPLRERTAWAHPAFAGYHMLVLGSLLTPSWLVVSFVVLLAASFAWRHMALRKGSMVVPMLSHVLADLGVIVAAWWPWHG